MPESLLAQAHKALIRALREEAEEQVKLTTLEADTLELQQELEQAKAALAGAETADAARAARTRVADLSQRKKTLEGLRVEQELALRKRRDHTQAARNAYEKVQREISALKELVRQEVQVVADWERQVRDAEEQLARCRQMVAQVRTRLEQIRAELKKLTGE